MTGKDGMKWLWQHKVKGILKALKVKVEGHHRDCGFSARPSTTLASSWHEDERV